MGTMTNEEKYKLALEKIAATRCKNDMPHSRTFGESAQTGYRWGVADGESHMAEIARVVLGLPVRTPSEVEDDNDQSEGDE